MMMTAGKKFLEPTTLMQVAMVMSMFRPELQGFLGQNTTPPMPIVGYPQNFTGVAFAPSSTSNIDFHLAAKEAAADSSNPLSEFLDWHTSGYNQFDSDSVAMLFDGETHAPRETRESFSTELDSGYCSDGSRSPSALSSVSGSPPHDHSPGFEHFQETESDLSAFGATGYTPPPSDLLDLKSLDFELEDFIDIDSILYDPLPETQDNKLCCSSELSDIKTEPQLDHDAVFGRKIPDSPDDFQVTSDPAHKNPLGEFTFEGLEDQFYDPFSIDFPATNEGLQDQGTSMDSVFDFDSLADTLDVFNPARLSPEVDGRLHSLLGMEQTSLPQLSEAATSRNDSGFTSTDPSETPLSDANSQDPLLPFMTSVTVKQEVIEDSTISSLSARKAYGGTKSIPTQVATKSSGARPRIKSSSESSLTASEEEIIEMSIAEFNSYVESLQHPDAQIARDIRRRGKNKVAARLCRKRKIDVVCDIDDDIQKLRDQKKAMLEERQKLEAENAHYKNKISELQSRVFKSLRDERGQPLSPKEYSLFQSSDGSTYVGKNIDSASRKKSRQDV